MRLPLPALIITAALVASQLTASAQTNSDAATNRSGDILTSTNEPPTAFQQARAFEQATERIRADCINGRRIICGRIEKVLPDGLIVESGYISLMRAPLDKSWLIPGTVQAAPAPNLVEANEPGCVCVGLVLISDLPKSRSAKPKRFDYVVIQGYPEGQYSYTSVGDVHRTVRRFSAELASAVRRNRDAAGIHPPVLTPESK